MTYKSQEVIVYIKDRKWVKESPPMRRTVQTSLVNPISL